MLHKRGFWDKRAGSFRRYEGKRDEYANNIFSAIAEHGIDLDGKRVLDLGCGSGGFAIGMAKEGAIVTAMDISPKMLEIAAEDAVKHGMDIKFIESDWDNYENDEDFDIIFCSLTPAIHNDASREKLLKYAREHVVYIGFMNSADDEDADGMSVLYSAHGVKPRAIVGAFDTHNWLKRKGIKYSTYSFRKYRKSVKSSEDMIQSCVQMLETAGAIPDTALIEKFIERFKTDNGMYIMTGYNNVDMIIWEVSK